MAVIHQEIEHSGEKRTCHVFVPDEERTRRALVVVLHGGGGDGAHIQRITHFDTIAAREGFCVAYPDAVGNVWNSGGHAKAERDVPHDADDTGFLALLIESLVAEHALDPARVFLAGASNGAMMCHRMACESSALVAGVGMVMGAIPAGVYDTFAPTRPVPALFINGTEDPIVPWEGGTVRVGRQMRGQVVSVAETVAFWVRHNGASEQAEREWLPKQDNDGDTRVWREVHHATGSGANVVLYGVEGGGHTWPGGEQYLAEWIIGKTNRDFDASETLWGFFAESWARDGSPDTR